jgi:hypothetical protein
MGEVRTSPKPPPLNKSFHLRGEDANKPSNRLTTQPGNNHTQTESLVVVQCKARKTTRRPKA